MEMSNSTASFQEIQDKFNDCRQILTAIGDEVRQSILVTLMQNTCKEGMRVGEITAHTHLSRPAVSHHLKVMKDAGIVRMRKEGTMTFYHINVDAFEPLKKLVMLVDETMERHY